MMVTFGDNKKSKVIKGVLLEKAELAKVIKLIDRSNASGLTRYDAILQMRLKEALGDLANKKPVSKQNGANKPSKGKPKKK